MDNSTHANGTILDIVGRRSRYPLEPVPPSWALGYGRVRHPHGVPHRLIVGLMLIAAGASLLAFVRGHRRRHRRDS